MSLLVREMSMLCLQFSIALRGGSDQFLNITSLKNETHTHTHPQKEKDFCQKEKKLIL